MQEICNKKIYKAYKSIKEKHYIFKCQDKDKIRILHSNAINDISTSKPEYYKFDKNSPNFRKSNFQNEKSIVKGYFHQYNYFPWNKKSFDIFNALEENIKIFFMVSDFYCEEKIGVKYFDLTGLSLKNFYNDKFFIRICYQHFPFKNGYLSIHRDPVGIHQLSAPLINLSERKNYGLYYIKNDKKINSQELMSYGDTFYMDQSRLHAVEHDLFNLKGTEHFLISVHRYHSDPDFLKSSNS